MKVALVVINFVILYANADLTMDLGPIDLSASIGRVKPLYKPLRPDDIKATKNGIEHLEWLRAKFPTGYGYMPPLDPLEKSPLEPIHIKKGIVNGDIVLSNLRIDGAKEFNISLAEIRMSINTVNVDITVPQIIGNVDFDVDILLGVIPILFSGHLESVLTGVEVVGVVGSTETPMNGLVAFQVTDDKNQLTADNLRLTLSDLSVEADEGIIRKWWGILKNDIASLINTMVVHQINDILKHYSTQEVRDFLLAP